MTQQEIDIIFNLTILIHEDKYFGKPKGRLDRNKLQAWVTKQLADSLNVYTIPCGSSWGVIATKKEYEEYYLMGITE